MAARQFQRARLPMDEQVTGVPVFIQLNMACKAAMALHASRVSGEPISASRTFTIQSPPCYRAQ